MRNINFGFQAIEHRYKVLGGKPYIVEDDRKVDLAKLLIIYIMLDMHHMVNMDVYILFVILID
jgi:hypothetical protein